MKHLSECLAHLPSKLNCVASTINWASSVAGECSHLLWWFGRFALCFVFVFLFVFRDFPRPCCHDACDQTLRRAYRASDDDDGSRL